MHYVFAVYTFHPLSTSITKIKPGIESVTSHAVKSIALQNLYESIIESVEADIRSGSLPPPQTGTGSL